MTSDIMAIIAQREDLLSKEKDLLQRLKRVETDITERKKELDRISEQIDYYTALVKDMKREMSPPSMDDIYKEI